MAKILRGQTKVPTFAILSHDCPSMRKSILYIFALLSLTLSCQRRAVYNKELVIVDTLLLHEEIDSALNILTDIDTHTLSARDLAYYHLLNTLSHFKNYETGYDYTDINNSINYFSIHEEPEMLARAYLYKGCILTDKDSLKPATILFKKAEQLVTNSKNMELKMRLFSMLAYINSLSGNNQKALSYIYEMLRDAQSAGQPRWIGHCYKELSVIYYDIDKIDSSDFYILKTIPYFQYIPPKERTLYYNNLGFYYKRRHLYQQAETCYMKSLAIRETDYAIGALADLYTKKNSIQKARRLWQTAIHTEDRILRASFLLPYAEWLYKIGEKEHAWSIATGIPSTKDSIQHMQQTEMIKESQEQQDRMIAEIHYKQMFERCILVILCIALSLLACWTYYRYKVERQRKHLAENHIIINEYEQQIERLIREDKTRGDEVEELKQKVEALRLRQGQILASGKMRYEEIVINNGNTSRWHKKDFVDFMEYFRLQHIASVKDMETRYKSLTPANKFFLALYELHFDDNRVAQTLGIATNSLRTYKSRIKAKLR